MIVFLTVSYILILLLLFKLKVLKPTLWWKLSPVVWVILLLVILFIPLQFWAPAGQLRIVQNVIQIVPQVRGRVLDVPIAPNTPLTAGDVLFQIDPRPYQYQVDKLQAMLADAGVNVKQLRENLSAAEAGVEQAQAQLSASETDYDRRAREAVQQARGQVNQVQANLNVSHSNLERIEKAAAVEAVSQLQLDAARREVESLEAQLDQARSAEEQARLNSEAGGDRVRVVSEQLEQAQARERSSRLAYEAQVEGMNPRVRQIVADLESARFNLDQATMRAPANGYAVNIQLRPGSFVVGLPLAPAMTFVESGVLRPFALLQLNHTRLVQPGQDVELALTQYPGRIFKAKVLFVIESTAQGQMAPSGTLPPIRPEPGLPVAVRLQLSEDITGLDLVAGVAGTAAIYTDSGKPTHVIRRVMIRMDTWLNYLRGMSV